MNYDDSPNAPWYRYKMEEKEEKYQYNGKELQDEVFLTLEGKEIGLGYLDFGFRYYDPSIGRFTGVDPISDQFAWVSTYNYAENSPIVNIDLWGLQGVKFTEKDKKGKDVVVVEATVHIGTGEAGFTEKEVKQISKALNKSFDKRKLDGKKVDFRFEVVTFDDSSIDVKKKAASVRLNSTVHTDTPNEKNPGNNKVSTTGVVLVKSQLPFKKQGETSLQNLSRVSNTAFNTIHTAVHEIAHFLLSGSPDQPKNVKEHIEAGGIFKPGKRTPTGEVIEETLSVSTNNLRAILNNVPLKKQ